MTNSLYIRVVWAEPGHFVLWRATMKSKAGQSFDQSAWTDVSFCVVCMSCLLVTMLVHYEPCREQICCITWPSMAQISLRIRRLIKAFAVFMRLPLSWGLTQRKTSVPPKIMTRHLGLSIYSLTVEPQSQVLCRRGSDFNDYSLSTKWFALRFIKWNY